MAGTVTTAEISNTSVRKITFTWTASAGGAADGTTVKAFDGKLIGLVTIPDSGTAPTDNYDIAIVDADGHDVLLGAGANRDTANTESVAETSLAGVAGSPLTIHVTNAGSGGKGVAVIYIR